MTALRALVARATSRAAWTRRLVLVVRAVDDAIAWKLEQERRAEARERQRARQRRQRRHQRATARRALVRRLVHGWRR